MIDLEFDSDSMIMLNGIVLPDCKHKCSDNADIIVFFSSLTNKNCLPFSTKLRLINGELVNNSSIEIIKFTNKNKFFIQPKYEKYVFNTDTEIIQQNAFYYNNEEHHFTIYQDGKIKLMIENDNSFIEHIFDIEITSVQITQQEINGNLFIIALGYGEELNSLTIINFEVDYQKIFDIKANEIIAYGEGVLIKFFTNDMLNRKVCSFYTFSNNEYKKINEYIEKNITHSYVQELLGHLFIESIIIGDKETAQNLLAEDINNLSEITDYLGDVIDIYSSGKDTPFIAEIVLKNKNGLFIQPLQFTISNNKIANLEYLI